MYQLTRIGNTLHRIPVFEREAIVCSHAFEKGCLSRFEAVFDFPESRALEGEDETVVYLGGGFDPFVVGAGEAGGGVDECPHY